MIVQATNSRGITHPPRHRPLLHRYARDSGPTMFPSKHPPAIIPKAAFSVIQPFQFMAKSRHQSLPVAHKLVLGHFAIRGLRPCACWLLESPPGAGPALQEVAESAPDLLLQLLIANDKDRLLVTAGEAYLFVRAGVQFVKGANDMS